MIEATTDYEPDRSQRSLAVRRWATLGVSAALLGWWVFNIVVQPTLRPSLASQGFSSGADLAAVEATESGSIDRQISVTLFFLIGAANYHRVARWMTRSPVFRRRLVAIVGPLFLYGAWAFLTLAWSTDVPLTVRRLAQLVLVVTGAVGLGAGFYGMMRNGAVVLARHVVIAASLIAGWVWLHALGSSPIRLVDPSWSLLSPGVGALVANPLSVSVLACVFLAYGAGSDRGKQLVSGPGIWILIGFLQLLTIFALRKRVTLALTVLVAMAYLLVVLGSRPRTRNAAVLGFVFALLLVFAVDISAPVDIVEAALPVASRDLDLDTATTLNGRVPLWQELMPFVEERAVGGHGFGAFWSARRLPEIQEEVGWPAVVGHSGFLDEALGTGYVGAGLVIAAFAMGMATAFVAARRERLAAATFAGFVVLLFLVGNVTQTILHTPTKTPFILSIIVLAALPGWRTEPAGASPPNEVSAPNDR